MAKNKINDLRNHLFETLEALKDADNPMDIQRAHAICEVSQAIINSAKVEVDLVKAVGGCDTASVFFGGPEETREMPRAIAESPKTRLSIEDAFAKRRA